MSICSLIQVSLEELGNDIAEHYVALSHVCGDPNPQDSVLVEGRRLQTTASLHCALRHLREPQQALRPWADGICTNQADVEDLGQ